MGTPHVQSVMTWGLTVEGTDCRGGDILTSTSKVKSAIALRLPKHNEDKRTGNEALKMKPDPLRMIQYDCTEIRISGSIRCFNRRARNYPDLFDQRDRVYRRCKSDPFIKVLGADPL